MVYFLKERKKCMKNLKTSTESQFPHISRGLGRGGDKKSAFTLAEVLITLGVIGVVAAMTLPTLIHNYQKTVYVNQLKKSYSILEQAFQKMLADDGVQKLSDTHVWTNMTRTCNYYDGFGGVSFLDDRCKGFLDDLSKYVKIIGVEKYNENMFELGNKSTYNIAPVATPNTLPIVLADGTMIFFYVQNTPTTTTPQSYNAIKSLGGNMYSQAGRIHIDVNGRRGPNTFGRDIFYFYLSDEGKLYPSGGKDYALYRIPHALDSHSYYWRNNSDCGNADGTMPNGNVEGLSCAARIMEEGWKMNY